MSNEDNHQIESEAINTLAQQPEEQTEITALTPNKVADKPQYSRSANFIYRLTIFLIIVCLCVIGGFNVNEIKKINAYATASANKTRAANQATLTRLATVDKSIQKLIERQNQQSDSLDSLYQNSANKDWAIAEIEQLLIIAMHRLTLANDVVTAIAAMEAADLRIKDIGDPELLPIRQQLAIDINQLRSVNLSDKAGLALYLSGIIAISDKLPLQSDTIFDVSYIAPTTSDTHKHETISKPLWQRLPSMVWQELKSLVLIKRSGETKPIFLLPKEAYFLRQNLKLELINARQSVLNADTKNLRAAIDSMQPWLRQYFDTADASVISLIETLDTMYQVELQPELPDINSSLESLRAYIHRIKRQQMDNSLYP